MAAAEPGAELALPVGPLRLMDATSGDVRTLLDGRVIAFFWAPDGKTVAALSAPEPGDDNVAEWVARRSSRAAPRRPPRPA